MTAYNATAVSVQAAKPTYRYGSLAKPPVQSGASELLVRVNIPADIPAEAIVTKADLVFTAASTWATSRVFNAGRLTAPFTWKSVWTGRPGVVVGTTKQVTVPAATANVTQFRIDVAEHVQGYVTGTTTNLGWKITTTSGTLMYLRGSSAASGGPWLDLEYVLPGDPPWNLAPAGGVVSTPSPVLTFSTPLDTTAVQAQISTTEDFAVVAWDSGQVDTPEGTITPSYAIAAGATVYWRAKALTTLGWSDWSAPVEVTYTALPVLNITGPVGTAGDVTPPITWTFAGQTAWQVLLYNDKSGALIENSTRQPSSTTKAWTPSKKLWGVGSRGRVEVRAWDATTDRVPNAAGGTYAVDTEVFTVVAAGVAPGPTGITATPRVGAPVVDVAWTVGTQADQWQITRRVEGGPVEWLGKVSGATRTFADWTAPRHQPITYRVVAVSNGETSTVGPTVTITLRTPGIWLLDPEEEQVVGLMGADQGTQTIAEQSVLHEVIGRAPVRRRLGTVPPAGEQGGRLIDAVGASAAASYATLLSWITNDVGHEYRLLLGDWNVPVTLGNIEAFPTPQGDNGKVVYVAGFSWWQTDEDLPWSAP